MNMFGAIWAKIKEMVSKMLPAKTIESVFQITPAVSDKMADAIQLWSDMYTGQSPWIREPTFDDPTRVVSLGLPAIIASEKARMATLEMESEITAPMKTKEVKNKDYSAPGKTEDGMSTTGEGNPTKQEEVPAGPSERAEFLNQEYKKLKRQLRRNLEYGIAKGGLVIKPYVRLFKTSVNTNDVNGPQTETLSRAEMEFDFVQADRFFPLSFDANGKLLEAAFAQTKKDLAKKRVFIRLEYHKLEDHTVTVQNMAFESTNMELANASNLSSVTNIGNQIPLTAVPEWASLEPATVIQNVDRLLFGYFRMPEANTVDPYSPLGVSGYSRVISLIRDADMQYSRLLWEYEAGEMAIDVDRDALKLVTDSEGKDHTVLPQKQQRLFRKIDLNSEDTYEVFAPNLRDASIANGLNIILMHIEDACGLSRGTISDVNAAEAKTATELKILKQRSYATNADIQAALQDALDDVIYVMNAYCSLYQITPEGEYEVSYEWDDSILVDSESELAKRLTLMQNKVAGRLETRMWYFGETENQARAAIEQIDEEARTQLKQNLQMEQKMGMNTANAAEDGKPAGKVSTGKQADSLEHPDKSKSANNVKNNGN